MKKIFFIIPIVLGIAAIFVSHAETTTQEAAAPGTAKSPVVEWVSKSVDDVVTIENGTGANLNIVINVNSSAQEDAPGISVKNCGDTKHIAAGSSAVCITNDKNNPVSFASDKTTPISGTYQITQQLPPQ